MAKIGPAKRKVTVTSVVSPQLNELITRRADEFGLTRSSFVALALADYLADLGETPEYHQLDGAADAYADSHDGEQLRLGYSSRMRDEIEAIVNEALAAKK